MATELQASPLTNRDELVEDLRRCMSDAGYGLRGVPQALKLILREGTWRERLIIKTRKVQTFERFVDFVVTAPLEGLGADIATLKRICSDDPEALDLLDQATQNPNGVNLKAGNNVPSHGRPEGNTAEKALRRLRKDRPDLHARVLAGEEVLVGGKKKKLSPHAAMVEAGFRPKTVSVPVDPVKAVTILARHFDPLTLRAAADLGEQS